MKTKSDRNINKAQYHKNLSLMTYYMLKTEKSKIGKINLEVLQALLDKLQLYQQTSNFGYVGKN